MKQGRTLEELARELDRQNQAKTDLIAPTQRLTMRADGMLEIMGDETVNILPLAHQQIGARVGIPAKYYTRMQSESPELLAHNVNHWFRATPENRMIRLMDNQARAFLSDRYKRRDNFDLMQAILPTLRDIGGLQVASCEVTDTNLYLKVVTPRVQAEVQKDDIVQAGAIISNSEVGQGAFKVQPLVLRLVCMNGMISNTYGMSKYHIGKRISIDEEVQRLYTDETIEADDTAFWLKCRDIVAGALKEETFQMIVAQLMEATGNPIKLKPTVTVERLTKRFMLNKNEGDSVLENLLREGELTMYGLANAVTATAKEDALSYDRATELEEVGGLIINLNPTEWRELAVA